MGGRPNLYRWEKGTTVAFFLVSPDPFKLGPLMAGETKFPGQDSGSF